MSRYNIDKKEVGTKIRDIRLSLDYSMEEFGKRIGVTRGVVNNYEKGRILPKRNIIEKIILLSDNPNQNYDNFVYGSSEEYLSKIFETLEKKFTNEDGERTYFWDKIFNSLIQDLDKGNLVFGDEIAILKEAVAMDEYLKTEPLFIELWYSYNLKPLKYPIAKDKVYTKDIIWRMELLCNRYEEFVVYDNKFVDNRRIIKEILNSLINFEENTPEIFDEEDKKFAIGAMALEFRSLSRILEEEFGFNFTDLCKVYLKIFEKND